MSLVLRTARVVFVLSLLFSLLRIPHATWSKRLRQVTQYRELGPIGYHLGRSWPELAQLVQRIREQTPGDAVLLWRGNWKGPIELVSALIGERLLYQDSLCPTGARRLLGRPLAQMKLEGRAGTVVLVADGPRIVLQRRR